MNYENEWNDLIQPYVEKRPNLVLTVGIIKNNKKEFFTKTNNAAMDIHDPSNLIYEIGSITKVFTSTLLAKAILENKIHLDDPITKFIPSLVNNKSLNENPVTIRHLTTHTAGIPSIPMKYYIKVLFSKGKRTNPYKFLTYGEILKYLEDYNFQKAKRGFSYSNTGTGILGFILTQLYESDYETLIQQEICQPLGLINTKIHLNEEQQQYLVQGHNQKHKPVNNWDFASLEGAGAVRSTVSDLLSFLEAHMNGVAPYFSLTHDNLFEEKDIAIGMNWVIDKNRNVIWHNGGTGGYSSFMGFNKEKQIGVVILSNYQPSFSKNDSVDQIGFDFLDKLAADN